MHTRTRHLLAEYHGCNRAVLDDVKRVEALLRVAAKAAGATIVASVVHPFSPQGVSGVVVIEESHLSIHTWPEHGYAAVDFFTCGAGLPERAHEVLCAGLEAQRSEVLVLDRGLHPEQTPSIRIRSHHADAPNELAGEERGSS